MPEGNLHMELRCLSAKGVRDGSLLSIKAGSKRCMVPYDSETFSKEAQRLCGISGDEHVKVEIFEPVSQARLIVEPKEARWDVILAPRHSLEEETDVPDEGLGGVMSLELELAKSISTPRRGRGRSEDSVGRAASARPGSAGSSSALRARHQGALTAAKMQPYFEKHSLFKVMQALLQAVIKEKPVDPYAYMVQMLQNSSRVATGQMQSSISSDTHKSLPEATAAAGCLRSGRRTRSNCHTVAFCEEAMGATQQRRANDLCSNQQLASEARSSTAEAEAAKATEGTTTATSNRGDGVGALLHEAAVPTPAAAAAFPAAEAARATEMAKRPCSSAEGKQEQSMTAAAAKSAIPRLCFPQYVPSHVSPLPEMLTPMKPAAPMLPSEPSCPPQHSSHVPQLACVAEDHRHIAWTRSLFEEVPTQEPVASSFSRAARPFVAPTHVAPSLSAGIARTAGRLPARSQSTPSLNPPSLLPLKGNGRPPRGRAIHAIKGFQQAEHQRKAETFSKEDDLNSPVLSASTQYTQERTLPDLSAGPSMLSEDDAALPVLNSPWREDAYKPHGLFGRAPFGLSGAQLSEGGSTLMAKRSSRQAEWPELREESHCQLRRFTQVGSSLGGHSPNKVRPGASGDAHADAQYFSDTSGLFPADGSSNWQWDATERGGPNGCMGDPVCH